MYPLIIWKTKFDIKNNNLLKIKFWQSLTLYVYDQVTASKIKTCFVRFIFELLDDYFSAKSQYLIIKKIQYYFHWKNKPCCHQGNLEPLSDFRIRYLSRASSYTVPTVTFLQMSTFGFFGWEGALFSLLDSIWLDSGFAARLVSEMAASAFSPKKKVHYFF